MKVKKKKQEEDEDDGEEEASRKQSGGNPEPLRGLLSRREGEQRALPGTRGWKRGWAPGGILPQFPRSGRARGGPGARPGHCLLPALYPLGERRVGLAAGSVRA